jgi:hypothetical protein
LYLGAHRRFQLLQELLNLTFFLLRKWLVGLHLMPLAQTVR